MADAEKPTPPPGKSTGSKTRRFEDYPLSRQEYLSVMVHFYRGEVQRSTSWRQRLDATTNWSVLTTAAMLSVMAVSRSGMAAHLVPCAFML